MNRGAGIYAVPVLPFMNPIAGFPPNTLIPLTYSTPTYQTGALTPLVRWLQQGMQRAAAPPQPPRPDARPDNLPPGARQGNENAAGPEGQPEGENEIQPLLDGNRADENNEHVVEPGADNAGNRWWGVVKEIQMIVFGFITSLLPGFHNLEHG
ncbi:hypothetical protein RHSIM_Rhsim01G0118000 [Rhododendron simsii]|uniref:Uncharacterized protein n=1 Tax=Rhododendron simsii TaxID=118357 RepID=A0A834HFQ1_RHOSS|nr:hypothetical protein RHSIM_Rhsim01G0118000 [Rhododendron simsii]